MKITAAIAAIASFLLGAGAADADTIYTLAHVKADIFAINPADISDQGGGRKLATYYYVHPSHLADLYADEFDCAGGKMISRSRRIVRSDLSPVRDLKTTADWETPDPRTVAGIVLKFVCAWPSPPARMESTTAESLAQFLHLTADGILAKGDGSSLINIDRTAVGDCIFGAMPKDLALKALTNVGAGRPPSADPAFREKVKTLGAKCIGRPVADNDSLVVGAALSIYMRHGIVARLGEKLEVTENHLAAAWNTAALSTRAPLLEEAAKLHTDATLSDIENSNKQPIANAVKTLMSTPELQTALGKVRNLNDTQKEILVYQYFMAIAMGEQAEAALASSPSKPQ